MNPPMRNKTMGSPTALATSDGLSIPESGNNAKANNEVTGIGIASNIHQVTIQSVTPKVIAASVGIDQY